MRTLVCACVLVLSSAAFAQVELVDPDAPAARKPEKRPASLEEVDPSDTPSDEDDDEPIKKRPSPTPLAAKKVDAGVPLAAKDVKPPEPVKVERPPPPAIIAPEMSDTQLDLAWEVWRAANEKSTSDIKAEQDARRRLITLKEEIGATNLDTWAVGLLRAAEAHEVAGDSGGAVEIARSATQLAPQLPATWVGLTRVYFRGDPSDFGRVFDALQEAVKAQLADVRYRRGMAADLLAILGFALIITTLIVLTVLAVRRGSLALYDFHFIFPRVASRWQTGALLAVLVSLPIVFRLGLVPVLLTVFFVLALYLTLAERLVAALLIGVVGLVPLLAQLTVEHFAFGGTRAEQLFMLERGGVGLEPLATELTQLAAEDKASYPELIALARYDVRRGRAVAAERSLKKALAIRPNDPSARINLGVALVLQGDLENPRALFEEAGKAAPELPQAPYNLGRLSQRRVAVFGDKVAGEVDTIGQSLYRARTIDPSYASLSKDADGTPRSMAANVYLQTVPLSMDDVLSEAKAVDAGKRVRSQAQQLLVGDVGETVAVIYPFVLALLIVGFGFLSTSLHAARACAKCGGPVSKRGDPDVSIGSLMCTQCVNVFAKKNVAAPSLKVRKQLEVAKYQSRVERMSSVMGFLCSGMGHVFAGFPVRGAIYGFVFVTLLTALVLRDGVVRAPFDPLPLVVRLVPIGIAIVALYVLTLRGLRKKQGVS